MRLFKFLAVFLIVVGLIFIMVVGSNWRVFTTVFGNQEALAEGSEWVEKTYSLSGLTEFAALNPANVSVVVLPMNSAVPVISQGSQVLRAMGSTGHLFLLLSWSEAVTEGTLSADDTIALSTLDRYVIPGHERSRHREALDILVSSGAVQDGQVPVRALVELMIRRNHQPSADVVYALLGAERLQRVTQQYLGEGAEFPLPWSAFYTTAAGRVGSVDADSLPSERAAFQAMVLEAFSQLESGTYSVGDLLPQGRQNDAAFTFFEEKYMYRMLPQVEPLAMATTLQRVLHGSEEGDAALRLATSVLRWPMEDSRITRDFTHFTAIYDSRIAISAGISSGTSVYTGETLLSAVYFDQLPIGFWMHLSANLMLQDFQMRLKYDPALFDLAQSQLKDAH